MEISKLGAFQSKPSAETTLGKSRRRCGDARKTCSATNRAETSGSVRARQGGPRCSRSREPGGACVWCERISAFACGRLVAELHASARPMEGRPGGGWREPADARGLVRATFEIRARKRREWEYSRGELAPAAGFSPQARMPPTARSAPRGARSGLLVLTAGPAYCSTGVTPPDPGGVVPVRCSAAAGLTPGDAKQQRRRGPERAAAGPGDPRGQTPTRRRGQAEWAPGTSDCCSANAARLPLERAVRAEMSARSADQWQRARLGELAQRVLHPPGDELVALVGIAACAAEFLAQVDRREYLDRDLRGQGKASG